MWWYNWIFRIITPIFSVTWFFRNHSNMLICIKTFFTDTKHLDDSVFIHWIAQVVSNLVSISICLLFNSVSISLILKWHFLPQKQVSPAHKLSLNSILLICCTDWAENVKYSNYLSVYTGFCIYLRLSSGGLLKDSTENCRLVLLSLILRDTTGLWLWTPFFPPKLQGGKNLFPVFSVSLSLSPLCFFSTSISCLELSLSNQLAKCFFREKRLENVKSFRGSFFKLSYLRRVWGARTGHKKIHQVQWNLEVCSLVKSMV